VDLVGLKPILRTTTSFSALTLFGWVIWPVKTVPEMTYNVFSGTLNPTHFTSEGYHNNPKDIVNSRFRSPRHSLWSFLDWLQLEVLFWDPVPRHTTSNHRNNPRQIRSGYTTALIDLTMIELRFYVPLDTKYVIWEMLNPEYWRNKPNTTKANSTGT